MRKVIGALAGLVATAAFAAAAAELLAGETGVDLLAGLKRLLPAEVLAGLAQAPLASPEGAPAWRAPIMGVAIAAGAAGGLLLLVTARLSAVLLWLAFLLLLGILVGQDYGVTGAWPLALEPAQRPELIGRAAVLGAALLFALIAHLVTGAPAAAEADVEPIHTIPESRVVDLRERLRAEPAPRYDEPPPARRARPPAPATPPLPAEQPPAPELRDLDRTRPTALELSSGPPPEPQREPTRSAEAQGADDGADEEPERTEESELVPVKG